MKKLLTLAVASFAILSTSGIIHAETITLRIGHFPNITHAQGLVAHQLSRRGEGWFEQRLGNGVRIEWYVYNAGPSAMEALFAHALDMSYVGPNPAINAYAKSQGEEIRIIAGAANGGAALVVHKNGTIQAPEDFREKRLATPQLGNTQDVSCRAWLIAHGYRITQTGGDVNIIPTANPDQLMLFMRAEIDGAWTVEPWVSRLEQEGNGRIYLEEHEAITTVLVASSTFLREHRELAQTVVSAHAELTAWIQAHPEEAQALIQDELEAETTRSMSPELISHAWPRLHFTNELSLPSLETFIAAAKQVGFLRRDVDFSCLVEQP